MKEANPISKLESGQIFKLKSGKNSIKGKMISVFDYFSDNRVKYH